jgi:hypothetical protein
MLALKMFTTYQTYKCNTLLFKIVRVRANSDGDSIEAGP